MDKERRPIAVLAGSRDWLRTVYSHAVREAIGCRLELLEAPLVDESDVGAIPKIDEVEAIFGTWEMPALSEGLLTRMPSLKAVFYAAGSVRPFVTEASWARGIRIYSAATVNSLPVAEFTLAQILLSMKAVPRVRIQSREDWVHWTKAKREFPSNYGSRVGLISYGMIARRVRELLRMCAHEVVVYDPYLSAQEAAREGMELVSLETLFSSSDVVSLHTPLLPATRGWIRGHHLSLMKPGATFINTARGAVVNQPELAAVLSERPDLTAVLDVLESEPPAADEPLLKLPNVWIYPHLAGSVGREYSHLAVTMLEAFEDYFAGRDCACEVREADMNRIA